MAQVNVSVGLSSGMTKAELIQQLASVPANATLTASYSEGDRPWESGSHTITAHWDTENPLVTGPHSRACGVTVHSHGGACSSNCPTCGGQA